MRTQRSQRLAAAALVCSPPPVTLTAAAAPAVQAAPAPVPQGTAPPSRSAATASGTASGWARSAPTATPCSFGWTWDQILGHYYGGTTLGPSDPNQALSVRLTAGDDDPVTAVIQDGGALATSATGAEQYRSAAAVEVAPGSYNVYARADAVNCPGATTAAEFEAPGQPVGEEGGRRGQRRLLGGRRRHHDGAGGQPARRVRAARAPTSSTPASTPATTGAPSAPSTAPRARTAR